MVLPTSSARAHTAAESKFRLSYPLVSSRAVRVVALDAGAESTVRRVAELSWHAASFYAAEPSWNADGLEGGPFNFTLRELVGTPALLNDVLLGVDAVIMVATSDAGTKAAAAIGSACAIRGIMTAGIIFGGAASRMTVSALRPYAGVLVVSNDEYDLEAILSALRA